MEREAGVGLGESYTTRVLVTCKRRIRWRWRRGCWFDQERGSTLRVRTSGSCF